jgi:hypothetical protein
LYSGAQSIIAQSSAEAEYYAAVTAANECIWLKQLLHDLGFPQETIEIYEDNQAYIALTKNPEDHKRTNIFKSNIMWFVIYVKKKSCEICLLPGSRLRYDLSKTLNQKLVFA